jgi:catechol 2,3-dioxygenase-like lactoylglutathione lyase family enzyme
MSVTLSHTFIWVHDQDVALDFYTGPVGLEQRVDADLGFMRWLTVGSPDQPDVDVVLLGFGPPLPPADVDTVRNLVTKGSMGSLIFRTEDCQATFERLRDAGAEVLQEPKPQDYGVIDCEFRDPSGNRVRFSQPR